jgi:hypothetical protein
LAPVFECERERNLYVRNNSTCRGACQPERSQTPHILDECRAARRFLLEGVIDFRSTTLIGIEPLERRPAAQQNAMEFAGTDLIFSDIALSGFTSQEEPPLPPSRSVSKALRALTALLCQYRLF